MIRWLAMIGTLVAIGLIADANPRYGLIAAAAVIGALWPMSRSKQ